MFCTCIQSGSSHNVVHSSSYLIAELIEYVLTKPKEYKEMMGVPLRGKNTAIHSPIATQTWRAVVVTLMCHAAIDRLSTVWVMVFLV